MEDVDRLIPEPPSDLKNILEWAKSLVTMLRLRDEAKQSLAEEALRRALFTR